MLPRLLRKLLRNAAMLAQYGGEWIIFYIIFNIKAMILSNHFNITLPLLALQVIANNGYQH